MMISFASTMIADGPKLVPIVFAVILAVSVAVTVTSPPFLSRFALITVSSATRTFVSELERTITSVPKI